MADPDFDRLAEICDEFEALVDADKATQADFDRLFKEAEKAVGPDGGEFLEGLMMRGFALGFYKL